MAWALVEERTCCLNEFVPSCQHLFQKSRTAGHRVIHEEVVLIFGLPNDQDLQVVRPHIQQLRGGRPQGFTNIDGGSIACHVVELEQVDISLGRERKPQRGLAATV